MSESNQEAACVETVAFETRFFDCTKPIADPNALLPYVRSVIQTIGCGGVEVVEGKGLHMTLPMRVAHHLFATLTDIVAKGAPRMQLRKIYTPPVRVSADRMAVATAMVERLRLCPPDMAVAGPFPPGSEPEFLFVSGPANKAREDDYRNLVAPNIRAVVGDRNAIVKTIGNANTMTLTIGLKRPLDPGTWRLVVDGRTVQEDELPGAVGRIQIVKTFSTVPDWLTLSALPDLLRLQDDTTQMSIVREDVT